MPQAALMRHLSFSKGLNKSRIISILRDKIPHCPGDGQRCGSLDLAAAKPCEAVIGHQSPACPLHGGRGIAIWG
jgi:hypothetical protein